MITFALNWLTQYKVSTNDFHKVKKRLVNIWSAPTLLTVIFDKQINRRYIHFYVILYLYYEYIILISLSADQQFKLCRINHTII